MLVLLLKVGKTTKSKEADYAVEVVNEKNLIQVIPEIWFGQEDEKQQQPKIDSVLSATTVGA